MKIRLPIIAIVTLLIITESCSHTAQEADWRIASQEDWQANVVSKSNLEITEGKVVPTATVASFQSAIKKFAHKRAAKSITITQSPEWLNWEPVPNIGPANLGDAPVALQLGNGNYWMFGRYNIHRKWESFQSKDTILEGFDVALKTTPMENQFDARGGLKPDLGGYHAWQSKDMVNWVHHGSVSENFSKWVTTAEFVDGKLYLYYDFPNDQDPHLYIDEDLTDGVPGKNMGMAFNDPTHGSDCAVIRDLEGNFHLIVEDWSPIDASTHAWDSPLAVHAVSPDGFNDFKILAPPVDERTKPTGEFAEYAHPHWHQEDPKNYPGRIATEDVPQHRIKAGQTKAFAKYEIHEPEQNAYGDWAAISIGGQYYLFADFDPAGSHGRQNMSAAWFTSADIDAPFTFCGNIGQGHPDPEILFAEGKFYLLTQMDTDYTSPGPWVESVEVRMGVDTTNDGAIDTWGDWGLVTEQYDYTEGFAKQIGKTSAKLDVSMLPEGFGFQFEVKLLDTTENASKPILDKVVVTFGKE
ncbi:hypothetical protein [Maribacter polysaccharolyticus]|uniref:hypothetical protein n=1 Tax=Maribacter polysaccharolyticus TaxID=3020831 RepID=UPI00237FB1F8|nr:hypothetical protein [Maribacter polysaccharolyticus]MDE3742699.1 hypothetical protein [Maribacter polysaccharolyticus]